MPFEGKIVQGSASTNHIKTILPKRKNNLDGDLFTSEEQFRLLVENSSDGIAIILRDRRIAYVSASVMPILGYSSEELKGKDGFFFFHPDDVSLVRKAFSSIVKKARSRATFQARVKSKKGGWVWIESTMTNLFSVPSIGGIVANFHDVTAIKLLQERQAILDAISIVLMASFDTEIILSDVIKFLVPNFADYCRIVTVDMDKNIKEVASYHSDTKRIGLVKKLFDEYIKNKKAAYGIYKILNSGKAEMMQDVEKESEIFITPDSYVGKVIKKLQVKSYIGVPLIARGKVVGAMTFSSVIQGRYYSYEDLHFAEEIGRRLALSLDNASLFTSAQNEIAERKRLEKQKVDFVANASHELKTPLTSIKAYTQVLEKRFEKEGNKDSALLVNKMDMQLDKLTDLIKDLLDISNIESGRLTFHESLFPIDELSDEIIEEMQRFTQTHTIIKKGNTKGIIRGDRERIGQVLTNLLSNAIKYSPKAEKVYVKMTKEKKGITICVQDFGIGILPENQSHVFERFYRVREPLIDTFPGIGLGLYISNEIVKRQGGRMSLSSTKGKGSRFFVWLPCATRN